MVVLRRSFFALALIAWLSMASHATDQSDPISHLLTQLASPKVAEREAAFYALMKLGSTGAAASSTDLGIPAETKGLLTAYPTDAANIKTALIRQLAAENASPETGAKEVPASAAPGESQYGAYSDDLVTAVVALNDVRSLPLLIPLLDTGTMVIHRVVSFGAVALDPVLATLYDPRPEVRDGAIFAVLEMISSNAFADSTSRSKIRAGLVRAKKLANLPLMQQKAQTGLGQLPPLIDGDLNADGLVNCADLAIIKASFGKKVGEVGFDIRADVNGDGVVNILDVSAEARLMLAGTTCP